MACFPLPQIGERNGETFRIDFIFRPAFQPVSPAYAGFFVLLLLFQKIGLGKLLSVNYLFGFFELKFFRVVCVHRGGDCTAQTMPRPNAHDLACNAGLFATTDEGVPQLVRVVVGQQSLHARGNGVEVGVLCPLEVDEGQHFPRHRGEGDLAKHDVLSQSLFARFAL